MKKIYLLIVFLMFITTTIFSATGVSAAQTPEGDSPFQVYLPMVANPPPPAPPETYSTSRYMLATKMQYSWNYGCEAGLRDKTLPGAQDSVVILFYGKPKLVNGVYGTLAYGAYVTVSQIADSVKEYARGYWECSGEDTQSTIEIAVGTSNLNWDYMDSRVCQDYFCTYDEGYNHGKAWVQMVKEIDQWIRQKGYAGQIRVAGASDIELAWNTPTVSHGWVDGFNQNDDGYYIFYNFGTCDGCPTRLSPTWNPVPPWTMWDVYYSAWYVASVWPIPEIYANSGVNARQWAYLSYWGATHGYWKIEFAGSLTQHEACNSTDATLDYCLGDLSTTDDDLYNTPEEGWQQLFDEINYWTITSQPALRWMTDIRWP